jgi:membrane-bound serine protease (ClpP class)
VELALVLLFLGMMFVVAEIFFPSFGMLSVLAASCLITSIVLAFGQSQTAGFVLLGIVIVSVPALVIGAFRVLPRTGIGRRLILAGPDPSSEGPVPTAMVLQAFAGKTGVTVSTLRPSGIANIEGRRVDVVADGESIPVDCPVKVVLVEGNRVVVERITENS